MPLVLRGINGKKRLFTGLILHLFLAEMVVSYPPREGYKRRNKVYVCFENVSRLMRNNSF